MTAQRMPGSPVRIRPVLSQPVAFWTSASVIAVALWSSASPSLVYPLYTAEWGLNPSVTTILFATYPIALIVTIVAVGDISDYVGRRASLIAGILSAMVGVLLFAVAPDLTWLFVGRAFQGIGVGVAVSAASAALLEFAPGGSIRLASAVNTAATAVGLASAVLLGGALVEYAPLPTRLTFWILLAVMIVPAVLLFFMPRDSAGKLAPGKWRPRFPRMPRRLGPLVGVAMLAGIGAFIIGSLAISLGAQIARDLIGTDNVLIAGASLAVFALAIAGGGLAGGKLHPRHAIVAGGFSAAVGMGLVVLSTELANLPLYVVACLGIGAGNGLLFVGSLGMLNRFAPERHRAQVFSVLYLVCYLLQGLTAILAGACAALLGFQPAIALTATAIGATCLAAAVAALLTAHSPGDRASEDGD